MPIAGKTRETGKTPVRADPLALPSARRAERHQARQARARQAGCERCGSRNGRHRRRRDGDPRFAPETTWRAPERGGPGHKSQRAQRQGCGEANEPQRPKLFEQHRVRGAQKLGQSSPPKSMVSNTNHAMAEIRVRSAANDGDDRGVFAVRASRRSTLRPVRREKRRSEGDHRGSKKNQRARMSARGPASSIA